MRSLKPGLAATLGRRLRSLRLGLPHSPVGGARVCVCVSDRWVRAQTCACDEGVRLEVPLGPGFLPGQGRHSQVHATIPRFEPSLSYSLGRWSSQSRI